MADSQHTTLQDVLNEVERNLHDAMGVARNVALDPRLVPGGGAVEMAVARGLNDKASTVSWKLNRHNMLGIITEYSNSLTSRDVLQKVPTDLDTALSIHVFLAPDINQAALVKYAQAF